MASVNTGPPDRTLIDQLLAEQRDLSAVSRFSLWHNNGGGPALARHYRSLIPLSVPGPGEQYAFEVDLDKCSGCKACVSACHSLNGLNEHETWRSTGLLISSRSSQPHVQTVTTACHHCVDPGCLNGCPVLAYDKDPATGIVRHLDDQCIGCQYCVLMCPYEVPQYSGKRGIVRKCDMCHQRLTNGEAPACVQACPDEAIRITIVRQDAVRQNFHRNGSSSDSGPNKFLPGSPNPSITQPTTRYISARPVPAELIPADAFETRIQPLHLPLVWMLVLSQLGVGGYLFLPLSPQAAQPVLAVVALTATLFGLAGAILHLGRPLKAWRAFLGLRRSWLSREIIVFNLFMPLAVAATASCFLPDAFWKPALLWLTALAGIPGVFCSAMIYHATQRVGWRGELSIGRFFATTALLGLATTWVATEFAKTPTLLFPALLVLVSTVKIMREMSFLRRETDTTTPPTPLARSATLMRSQLGLLLGFRVVLGAMGGVALPVISLAPIVSPALIAATALFLCLAGELAERALFFLAVATTKMPGGVAS